MTVEELRKERGLSRLQLSKLSGLPYSTVQDICTGKTSVAKCSVETAYKLMQALHVEFMDLAGPSLVKRPDFELFKSEICHRVKRMGDIDFLIETLEEDKIRQLYRLGWYAECLYLLAMVDYLSRENNVPLADSYNDLRHMKMPEPIYPTGVLAVCAVMGNDDAKEKALQEAIPEFKRHNIIESDIRNVA